MNPIKFKFGNDSLKVFQQDGQVFFDAEQAAIGLGIYQLKSGHKYVRWERVNKYLNSPQVGKGQYISEPQFYTLAIKADNSTARKFQHWVTGEVLPAIRKHGAYMTDEKAFNVVHNSNGLADLLQQAADQLKAKDVQIAEMKPKVDYFDTQMHNPGLMTVTEISKDYGMTAQELNSLLHKFGIQFKQGKHWVLYRKYDGKGYTQYEPFAYNDNKGVHNNLKWTQRGRKFIYDTLKGRGILPVLEQPELLPEAMD